MNKNLILINRKRRTIYKTESGKSWSKKGMEETNDIISREDYNTYTSEDTIAYHNGFMGGTCKAKYSYECIGYVVTEVISISPKKDLKHIDSFQFIVLDQNKLKDDMGYREREIFNNLDYFIIEIHNGKRYITFYSEDKEDAGRYNSFMIEYNSQNIVN